MRRIWIDTMLSKDGVHIGGSGFVRARVPEKLAPFYAGIFAQSLLPDATADENADVAAGRVVERRVDLLDENAWRIADLLAADAEPAAAAGRHPSALEALKPILRSYADGFQTEIDAHNPWGKHGTYYDDADPGTSGDGWHENGVTLP